MIAGLKRIALALATIAVIAVIGFGQGLFLLPTVCIMRRAMLRRNKGRRRQRCSTSAGWSGRPSVSQSWDR